MIRQQLREPTKKILGDLPFVYEVKNESDLDGVYLTKVKGIETISVFFRLSIDSISRAGVTFPPLSLSTNETREWSIYGEDVDYYKLNESEDYLSFDRLSHLENTRYTPPSLY